MDSESRTKKIEWLELERERLDSAEEEQKSELEISLRDMNVERVERLKAIDQELAESVEGLHEEMASKQNEAVMKHKQAMAEIEASRAKLEAQEALLSKSAGRQTLGAEFQNGHGPNSSASVSHPEPNGSESALEYPLEPKVERSYSSDNGLAMCGNCFGNYGGCSRRDPALAAHYPSREKFLADFIGSDHVNQGAIQNADFIGHEPVPGFSPSKGCTEFSSDHTEDISQLDHHSDAESEAQKHDNWSSIFFFPLQIFRAISNRFPGNAPDDDEDDEMEEEDELGHCDESLGLGTEQTKTRVERNVLCPCAAVGQSGVSN